MAGASATFVASTENAIASLSEESCRKGPPRGAGPAYASLAGVASFVVRS